MALTKEVLIDKIEVLEDGTIQTREVTRILEDGVVISSQYTNRKIIEPGQDYSSEPQKVIDVVAAVHTNHCKAMFAAKVAAVKAKEEAERAAQVENA